MNNEHLCNSYVNFGYYYFFIKKGDKGDKQLTSLFSHR